MMARSQQDRLLTILMRDGQWMTAARLADVLGVTPRSVRSYVAALNDRVPESVESGTHGYRPGPAAAHARGTVESATPRGRLHALVRALLDGDDGVDVYATAQRLHVSEATVDADLARVRGLIGEVEAPDGLRLERSGSRVRLDGPESARRMLLSGLVREELDEGGFDVRTMQHMLGERSAVTAAFGAFKGELATGLAELGYFVNEYGLADVVMQIAIAADRVAQGRPLSDVAAGATQVDPRIPALLDQAAARHLDVRLGAGDLYQLSVLLETRVVTARVREASDGARPAPSPEIAAAVREVVDAAAEQFLVDIARKEFVDRLGLHVQNLRERAAQRAWSRNPMARQLKAAYPMIFEIAVFLADGLQERLGIAALSDDEISYLAMHVGSQLERNRRAERLLSAVLVCPGYYEMHELLHSHIDRVLGDAVEIVDVRTRVDVDWEALHADLVLTTIDAPLVGERVVRIQPFLTDADIDRVRAAAARVRRSRRLARLRTQLGRYLSASGFVRGLDDEGEEAVIRRLGARLVAEGVIDADYVERAVVRERRSSTAFTETLAVPHAIEMTAARTAIAVGIADPPIRWGHGRVQVVALVAFSQSDREAFQTVFEQFVEVFTERDPVQRIVRRGVDFASFLDELAAVIDG